MIGQASEADTKAKTVTGERRKEEEEQKRRRERENNICPCRRLTCREWVVGRAGKRKEEGMCAWGNVRR